MITIWGNITGLQRTKPNLVTVIGFDASRIPITAHIEYIDKCELYRLIGMTPDSGYPDILLLYDQGILLRNSVCTLTVRQLMYIPLHLDLGVIIRYSPSDNNPINSEVPATSLVLDTKLEINCNIGGCKTISINGYKVVSSKDYPDNIDNKYLVRVIQELIDMKSRHDDPRLSAIGEILNPTDVYRKRIEVLESKLNVVRTAVLPDDS